MELIVALIVLLIIIVVVLCFIPTHFKHSCFMLFILLLVSFDTQTSETRRIIGGHIHNPTSFPYKRYFISKDKIPVMLDNIRDLKYVKCPSHLSKEPALLEIARLPGLYDEADVIGDLYTEEERVKANVKGQKSPLNLWKTQEPYIRLEAKKRFPKLYNINDTSPTGKNAYALRETIYQVGREATQFSPSSASAIYHLVSQYLKRPIDILDPFAGWGDRMIAAKANLVGLKKVNSYTGLDANENLQSGYEQIKSGDDRINFNITDTAKYKPDKQYDLVFTSPPYYDFEIYTVDEKQSIHNRPTYKQWLATFYEPTLLMLVDAVKPGCFFIIHVGDTFSAPTFVADTKRILSKKLVYFNQIYFGTKGPKSVPALIFIKPNQETLRLPRKGGCRIFNL